MARCAVVGAFVSDRLEARLRTDSDSELARSMRYDRHHCVHGISQIVFPASSLFGKKCQRRVADRDKKCQQPKNNTNRSKTLGTRHPLPTSRGSENSARFRWRLHDKWKFRPRKTLWPLRHPSVLGS